MDSMDSNELSLFLKKDEPEERPSFYKDPRIIEAVGLLIEDGWKKVTRDIDDVNVLVLDPFGNIYLRFLQWDCEYSDWQSRAIYHPCFFKLEKEAWADYNEEIDSFDDNLEYFLICDTIPKQTAKTKKAHELIQDFWDEEEQYFEKNYTH